MLNFDQLEATGWSVVEGIRSAVELMKLASLVGCPVPSSNGELVMEIRVTAPSQANPGTQSSIYGKGRYS
jgi:hypothetical protein